MKFSVEVTITPSTPKDPLSWQVSFMIVHENGASQYVPVTVYKYQIDDTSDGSIAEAAARVIMPQQVAMAYGKYQNNRIQRPDFFDTM